MKIVSTDDRRCFSDVNVDKSLSPVSLVNKTLEDNPVYSTPIVVIAGSLRLDSHLNQHISAIFLLGISHNSLRMCLETLLMQPGIQVENVVVRLKETQRFSDRRRSNFQVTVDEKFSEPLALIDLFGFKGEKTTSSSTYMGKSN